MAGFQCAMNILKYQDAGLLCNKSQIYLTSDSTFQRQFMESVFLKAYFGNIELNKHTF